MKNPTKYRVPAALWALWTLSLACLPLAGCDRTDTNISPVYDEQTGRLKQLRYDSNANGVVDTVSFMDGARIDHIEIDKNEDGKVDRWEHYTADQTLEKVGLSRADDGKADAWTFASPDGTVTRVEVMAAAGTAIARVEHYEKDALTRTEEDTNADGRMDKWEVYAGSRLVSVSFDSTFRGTPDRRLLYGADGIVTVETDPDGDGQFAATR